MESIQSQRGTIIKRIILMAAILLLSGCYAAPNESHVYTSTPVQSTSLNVFFPAPDSATLSNGKRSAIILVHGGGWNSSSKMDMSSFAISASELGFVGFAIDYRLTTAKDETGGTLHPWPAQANDVRCAAGWIVSHADDYNIDLNHISIVGDSAGGQIALMVAEGNFLSEDCAYTGDVEFASVVSRSGPADLVEWYVPNTLQSGWMKDLLNANPPTLEQLRDASPAFHMRDAADTKILLQHGELDFTIPPGVVVSLTDSLSSTGRQYEYMSYPEYGHLLGSDTRTDALNWVIQNTGE